MMPIALTVVALIAAAHAKFDCANVEVGGKLFDLSDKSLALSVSHKDSTPPSVLNLQIDLDPCNALKNSKCVEPAHLCGVQSVEVDGKTTVTQIMPMGLLKLDDKLQVDPYDLGSENDVGVQLRYNGNNYGDDHIIEAEVQYVCSKSEKQEMFASDYHYSITIWSPKACPKGEAPGKGGNGDGGDKNESSGNSWGWFFFLISILVVIFIGNMLFLNFRRRGGSTNFNALLEIGHELPYLLRDLAQRVLSLFRPSRGGYNAL